jgi:hypothetical protein
VARLANCATKVAPPPTRDLAIRMPGAVERAGRATLAAGQYMQSEQVLRTRRIHHPDLSTVVHVLSCLRFFFFAKRNWNCTESSSRLRRYSGDLTPLPRIFARGIRDVSTHTHTHTETIAIGYIPPCHRNREDCTFASHDHKITCPHPRHHPLPHLLPAC